MLPVAGTGRCVGRETVWRGGRRVHRERRGRDSNPRSGVTGLQFSRLVHSTALPPLRNRLDAQRDGFSALFTEKSSTLRGGMLAGRGWQGGSTLPRTSERWPSG